MEIEKLNLEVEPNSRALSSDFNNTTAKVDEVIDNLVDLDERVEKYTEDVATMYFQQSLCPVDCKSSMWGDNVATEEDACVYASFDTVVANKVIVRKSSVDMDIVGGTIKVDVSSQPNPDSCISSGTYEDGKVTIEFEGDEFAFSVIGGAFRIDENVDVEVEVEYGVNGSTISSHFLIVPNWKGDDGNEGGQGVATLTSFVFVRQDDEPSKPSGGTYANPVPEGWYDTVPTDSQKAIWMSKRLFYSDDHAVTEWSRPALMADTVDFDVIYSEKVNPATPTSHPFDDTVDLDWIDDVVDEDVIWMATSRFINGEWQSWNVFKVKGEEGKAGDTYLGTGEFYYAAATEDETLPEHTVTSHSGWSSTVPSNYSKERPYLWNFEIVSYTQYDGTVITTATEPEMICFWGQDGRSIGSIEERYLAKADGEDPPADTDEGYEDSTDAGFSKEKPNLYNREIILDTEGEEISRTAWQLISHWGETGVSSVSADLSNEVDTIGVGDDGILDVEMNLSTTYSLYFGVTLQTLKTLSAEVVGAYEDAPITCTCVTRTEDDAEVYTGEIRVKVGTTTNFNSMDGGKFIVRITGTSEDVTSPVSKDFTIFGSKDAKDGQVFKLVTSVDAIIVTKDADNNSTYSVTTVSCERKMASGDGGLNESTAGSLHYRISYKDEEEVKVTNYTAFNPENPVAVNNDSYLSVEFAWFSHETNATGTQYDRESIPLVRWGNNGSSSFTADLSNEVDTIGIGSDSILDVATELETVYKLYYGTDLQELSSLEPAASGIGSNSSSLVTFEKNLSTGLVKVKIAKTFDFTKCSDSRFLVNITGSCSGLSTPITKAFSILGNPNAEDGEVLFIKPSVSSVVVSKDANDNDVYSVQKVSCTRYKKIGTGDATTDNTGGLYYRLNEAGNYMAYPSGGVNVQNANYTSVTFYWYSSVNTSYNSATAPSGTLRDHETVPIVRWGKKGEKGDTGAGVKVRGHYPSIEALLADYNGGNNANFQPADGDGWIVDDTGHIWVWSDEAISDATYYRFIDCGKIQGDAGHSEYLHIAWCKTVDNSDNSFTVSKLSGQAYDYMGTRHDEDPDDSPNWGDYSWVYTKGEAGRSITSVTNRYLWTNSGTAVPSTSASGWTDNAVPTHPDGKDYLWNYEVNMSGDDIVSTSTPTCIGYFSKDGLGITSITEYYQLGGATAPNPPTLSGDKKTVTPGQWSTVASSPTKESRYLWNVEVTKMTDNTYRIGTVHLACVRGEDGASVKVQGHFASIEALVAAKRAGTINPTDGDGYVVDDTGHLWVWSSEAVSTTDHLQFVDCGAFKGDDGLTWYVHIAWANQPDGSDMVYEKQTGAEYDYMGTCINQVELDRDVPYTDYSWIYIKGEKGDPGEDAYMLDIDNEMDAVPATNEGVITATDIQTQVNFFKGSRKQAFISSSSGATGVMLTASAGSGMTLSNATLTAAQFKTSNGKFTAKVTAMTVDKAEITFTANYYVSGNLVTTKTAVMTINRVKAGLPGDNAVIYQLLPSVSSISRKGTNYTPASGDLYFYILRKEGEDVQVLEEDVDGYVCKVSVDGGNESVVSVGADISFTNAITSVTIRMYKGNDIVDIETIPIVADGENATSPYSFDLSNEMDSVAAKNDGTAYRTTLTTQANFYIGSAQVTQFLSSAPSGTESGVLLSCTVGSGITMSAGATTTSALLASNRGSFSGTVTAMTVDKANITFTARYYDHGVQMVSKDAIFSITRVKGGENGETPVIRQLMPSSSVIKIAPDGTMTPASNYCSVIVREGDITTTYTDQLPDGVRIGLLISHDGEYGQEVNYVPGTSIFLGDLDTLTSVKYILYDSMSLEDNVLDREEVPVVRDGDDGDSVVQLVADISDINIPLDAQGCCKESYAGYNCMKVYFSMHIGEEAVVTNFTSLMATLVSGDSDEGAISYSPTYSRPANGYISFATYAGEEMVPLIQVYQVTGKVTYNGVTYTRSTHIKFTGVTAGTSTAGPQGLQGCVINYMGEWQSGFNYRNDSNSSTGRDNTGVRYIDMVSTTDADGNVTYWLRTVTPYPSASNRPGPTTDNSTYWISGGSHEFIATKVLWTESAWISNLTGKSFYVVDQNTVGNAAGPTIVGGLQSVQETWNGNVTDHTAPMIFAGSDRSGANLAKFRVYEDGYVYMGNANISGRIYSSQGSIGGWTIGQYGLTSSSINTGTYNCGYISIEDSTNGIIRINGTGAGIYISRSSGIGSSIMSKAIEVRAEGSTGVYVNTVGTRASGGVGKSIEAYGNAVLDSTDGTDGITIKGFRLGYRKTSSTSITLELHDDIVVHTGSSDPTFGLPDPSQCPGKVYYLRSRKRSFYVTGKIYESGAIAADSDNKIQHKGGPVMMFSDGEYWYDGYMV